MAYKSENLEKLKSLSEKIASEDRCRYCKSVDGKNEIVQGIEKICTLLEKPRLDKTTVKAELQALLAKLS